MKKPEKDEQQESVYKPGEARLSRVRVRELVVVAHARLDLIDLST